MSQPRPADLLQPEAFLHRHLGPDVDEQRAMLAALGLASRAELIGQALPAANWRPRSGSSTNTTSPRAAWAWSVMPTLTLPSASRRAHSWLAA